MLGVANDSTITDAAAATPASGDAASEMPLNDILTTANETNWASTAAPEGGRFAIAVAVAVLLHASPALVALGASLVGGLGAPAGEVRLGDPKGDKEGVNVEIIDATEYDRRYVSFKPGQDIADVEAKPPTPQPQKPAEEQPKQQPKQEQAQPEQAPKQEVAKEPAPERVKEPSPLAEPKKQQQLSEADIAKLLDSATIDMDTAVQATSRASMGAQGQVSEHIRGVLRRFKQTMPSSKGMRGTVIIGVVLADNGEMAWVGVLKSSGRRELDQLVVDRVRSTKLELSTKPLTVAERKLQITYEYQ